MQICNEVWQGECLQHLKNIPDTSVDMVLCEMPCSYGLSSCSWEKGGLLDLETLITQYKRIAKPSANIVLFSRQPYTTDLISAMRSNFQSILYWRDVRNISSNNFLDRYEPNTDISDIVIFTFNNDYRDDPAIRELQRYMIYGRGRMGGLECADLRQYAHYFTQRFVMPSRKDYFEMRKLGGSAFNRSWKQINEQYEEALHKYSTKYYPYQVKPAKLFKDVLKFDFREYELNNEGKPLYPTQKPVALLEYLIKLYTLEGETVLDNCMGSGSTGVACVNTSRRFIGIERDEAFYKVAKGRLEEATRARTNI